MSEQNYTPKNTEVNRDPGNTEDQITDESGDHVYFTMIPNIIYELGLSLYARDLYGWIKRRAGENGACWENVRNLSKHLGISPGRITKAKAELINAGLIVIEQHQTVHGHYPGHTIKITDVWKNNVDYFTSLKTTIKLDETTCTDIVSGDNNPPVSNGVIGPVSNGATEEEPLIKKSKKLFSKNENNTTPCFVDAKSASTKVSDHSGLINKISQAIKNDGKEPIMDAVKEAIILWASEVDYHNKHKEEFEPAWHYGRIDAILERYEVLTLSNDAMMGKQNKFIRVGSSLPQVKPPEDITDEDPINITPELAQLKKHEVLIDCPSPATISAWEDWEKIKIVANDHGLKDLADKLQPPAEASWRDIDKCISELKNEIQNVVKLSTL